MKKRILKSCCIGLIIAGTYICPALAQTENHSEMPKSKPEAETKPLELPDFIIEGKEQINLENSGIKQLPDMSVTLSGSELDSINSLEKQPSLLIPARPLPEKTMIKNLSKGFFRGEFGRYNTPVLEAGYDFKIAEYSIYANAGLDISQGHVSNSGYSQGFLKLASDYIAPEKFWIFGGSKTRFDAYYNGRSYKLYASQPAPISRSVNNMGANIGSEGNFEGYKFSTGAGLNSMQFSQGDATAFDNALNGYLYVTSLWNSYEVGAGALVDLHSVRGDGVHFVQADANMKIILDNITFFLNGGFQTTTSSGEVTRGGLMLNANAEYRLSRLITFRGTLFSGFQNTSLKQMMQDNPYLSHNAPVDYAYVKSLRGYINYHPSVNLSLVGGVGFGQTSRQAVYFTIDTADFNVNYQDTKSFTISGEAFWQPTSADNLNFSLNITTNTMDSSGNTTPYTVPFRLGANYRRAWTDNFGTQIGLYYIGSRYADVSNKIELGSYMNLGLQADYAFGNTFTVYARLDNLLNSDVYVWEGYKERSLFVSAGILWKF